MSLFKDMLGADESLFKNEVALDYSFLPKLLPHREQQQRYIATCIKPLLMGKPGKNLFVYGAPGIGKTTALRFILRELEEETDEIYPIYINCWQKNSTFKIIVDICEQLGYKLTHNKRTEELFEILKGIINKKSAVFAFDEVDKLEDFDFLYAILEDIYKKSVLLVTNHQDWFDDLDQRVKSRLMSESLEFKPYSLAETRDIMRQRRDYAFVPDVWHEDAFELLVKKAAEVQDIRTGLYLMREAGNIAEDKASRKIILEFAKQALEKVDKFTIKKSTDLNDEEKSILDVVKSNNEKKIGDLYKLYREKGGRLVYKSFQRKIDKLEKNKFVACKKLNGGKDGNTTIVKYATPTKKLTEF